ncbi:Scavenger receptor cysteine-rich type 1 M130 [Paramuricea clavata]|uniref:Scavenger receptor cysteine-rich type 1 M130 n=1 Tax=Paramuricea clavata TaxID=317549 RepID=A0A7D9I5T6_PARCT|nr:Scavenger receptor cysteine-rich type 1 M130 [Paramuricea clavata]
MVKTKPLYESNNSKASSKDYFDKATENIPSMRNNNESDRLDSLITIVQSLSKKFSCFEQKFEAYTQDVDVATNESGNNPDEQKDLDIRRLQEENERLKSTNVHLNECLNKYENAADDLKSKIKAVEDEKASLLTAIRLLHSDRNDTCPDTGDDRNAWSKVQMNKNKKDTKAPSRATKRQAASVITKSHTTNPVLNSNQYAPLTIEESEGDEVEITRETAPTRKFKSNTQASTVIIGDSMIKYIDSKRLLRGIKKNGQISRRTAIRAETYRGAGVDDMKHHIKPCLQRKPEKIILHVGTNDIGSKGAKELVKGINDICEIIQKDSPTSEVAVSLLVTRADRPEYKTKIEKVNMALIDYCESKNIQVIDHANIETKHLNPYGVHLSRLGTSIMARNFLSYINNVENN